MLGVLLAAQFMAHVDVAIVNLAAQALRADFDTSPGRTASSPSRSC